MADDKEETGTSATEAQIAVHWREEEYFYPPARFIGQANASDPAIFDRFTEEHFPECFREYAELLDWDEYWHDAGHEQPTVLEVVRGRTPKRLLQLY
jgi:acetyl-CoA synthetase